MITEDYVSFETAKLLKDKGFKGRINAYYHIWDNGKNVCSAQEFCHSEAPHLYIPAPTLQMAMKWLREEHNIYIDVLLLDHPNEGNYGYVIQNTTSRDYIATSRNNSYNIPEEAAEAAITHCLKNLI